MCSPFVMFVFIPREEHLIPTLNKYKCRHWMWIWYAVYSYISGPKYHKRCPNIVHRQTAFIMVTQNASNWNLQSGYWNYMSLNVVNRFWLFCFYFTLVKRVVIHFNNVKLHLRKDDLYPPCKNLSRLVWIFCVLNVAFSLSLCQRFSIPFEYIPDP